MADEEFMFGDLFATVRVQDLPASREVVAVERQENGTWRVCGSAIANTDGIAELGIEGSKTSRVYAFAIDHWGEPFTPNKTVAYGDIIRPSVFLGWLYRVTAPGVLPGEEPVWWNSTPGMPRPVGSAMAQAEMYFQPIAHGPVDIEWEGKQEGDPHWGKVVSLLHFEGDILDQISRGWEGNGPYGYEQGVFGSSISFSSDGQYLHTSGEDFNLGNEDFTLEIWVNQLANAGPSAFPGIFSKRDNSVNQSFFLVQDGEGSDFRFTFIDSANTQNNINFGYVDTNTLNTWRHIAIVREGARIMCFVQGIKEKEQAVGEKGIKTTTAMFVVGRLNYTLSTHQFIGKLDELRITKGVARYTENFTPPTEPFPNFK